MLNRTESRLFSAAPSSSGHNASAAPSRVIGRPRRAISNFRRSRALARLPLCQRHDVVSAHDLEPAKGQNSQVADTRVGDRQELGWAAVNRDAQHRQLSSRGSFAERIAAAPCDHEPAAQRSDRIGHRLPAGERSFQPGNVRWLFGQRPDLPALGQAV